jgi:RloB-like protein
MRQRNGIYTKPSLNLDSSIIFLFCEGKNTEPNYFNYFKRQISQLNLYILPFPNTENNSPLGMYNYCKAELNKEMSDYDEQKDSIWFCIDIDGRMKEIRELFLKIESENEHKINFAISNRSFEVWLYFHYFKHAPNNNVENWKTYINEIIPGGVHPFKTATLAKVAITNAKEAYQENNALPAIHSTNVYQLVEKILDRIATLKK